MKPVRFAVAFVALVLLAGSVVLSTSRMLTPDTRWWVLAASFVPFGLFGYLLSAALLALVRRGSSGTVRRAVGAGLVLSLLGVVLHAAWLVPSYAGSHAYGRPDLTILSLNMSFGLADPATTARLVKRERPDVIVLSEATPDAVTALAGEGVGGPSSPWPHQGGAPVPGISGTVVLSAYPVGSERRLYIETGAYRMRVQAPTPFWLTAVHTTQPLYDADIWHRDFAALRADARTVHGPRVEVGDFNATLDHGPMHELLDTGLHDAAREANAGWQPTWPAPNSRNVVGVRLPFGVMALDHVLLSRELWAIATTTHTVPATDHQALVIRIRLCAG